MGFRKVDLTEFVIVFFSDDIEIERSRYHRISQIPDQHDTIALNLNYSRLCPDFKILNDPTQNLTDSNDFGFERLLALLSWPDLTVARVPRR